MKSWHVWTMKGTRQVMEHVDANEEMEIIVDLGRPCPERIEPCDGKGFYCPSRGLGPRIRLGILEIPGLDGKPVTYVRGNDGQMHRAQG